VGTTTFGVLSLQGKNRDCLSRKKPRNSGGGRDVFGTQLLAIDESFQSPFRGNSILTLLYLLKREFSIYLSKEKRDVTSWRGCLLALSVPLKTAVPRAWKKKKKKGGIEHNTLLRAVVVVLKCTCYFEEGSLGPYSEKEGRSSRTR